MPLNEAQTEAVAQADAELNNAAMPTYSDLLALVKRSAYLLAMSKDATADGRIAAHRSHLVDAIKLADPAHFGL